MPTSIVKRIRELCEEEKTTFTALEMEIGLSRGLIKKWEVVSPSADKIIKVADYFYVSTDYLLGRSDYRYTAEARSKDKGLLSIEKARSIMSKTQKENMDKILEGAFDAIFRKTNC